MPRKSVAIGPRQLTLDARPDRLDLRDRSYQPPLGSLPAQFPTDDDVRHWFAAYADAGLVLNQGEDGACTGFGLAAVINYLLYVPGLVQGSADKPRRVSPAMLYRLAQVYDEWPGEDYEGSSCRGALKGWHRHGVCSEALWPYALDAQGRRQPQAPLEDAQAPDDPARNWDVDALRCTLGVYYRINARSVVDMQAAISHTGAIYVQATVHEGWAVPARAPLRGHEDLPAIRHVPKPKKPGGHAFALVGYNELGFVVQNSWGEDWGARGFALLPYEDWTTHGQDAWTFTLGVPRLHALAARGGARPLRSPRFTLPSSGAQPVHDCTDQQGSIGLVGGGDAFSRRYRDLPAAQQPLDADQAYRHALLLDRGFPVRNDITAEDAQTALAQAALQRPLAWMQAQGSRKLLVYAHGGLNSEADSIARVRAIAPYALGAGLYPLFLTWRSGALETVGDLVEEALARMVPGAGEGPSRGWMDRLTDKTDRLLEPLLRAPGGAMWGQMKLNAERASSHAQGGVRAMVEQLKQLAAQRPGLEIHLIGHSAGAIVLGAMLPLLAQAGLKAATLRLFAPACTLSFALDYYKPAVENGTLDARRWILHVLSDRNELDDSVGPYRKSLLYLVSRSFEDLHKTPLMGMAKAFDAATATDAAADDQWSGASLPELRAWQAFWAAQEKAGAQRLELSRRDVPTGVGSIAASHGCFDNAVDLMGDALGYARDPKAPQRVSIRRLDY